MKITRRKYENKRGKYVSRLVKNALDTKKQKKNYQVGGSQHDKARI